MSGALDRLQALSDAATPGPWTTSGEVNQHEEFWMRYVEIDRGREGWTLPVPARSRNDSEAVANAEFIAASRAALPALIAVARAAEEFGETCGGSGFTSWSWDAARALRDALAKLEAGGGMSGRAVREAAT